MKKLFNFVMVICTIITSSMLTACDTSDSSRSVELGGIDVTASIDNDYTIINDSDAVFYESQITLSNPLDSTYKATVSSVVNIFQLKDTCYQFIHELKDSVVVDSLVKVNDFWMEDARIGVNSVIPFKIALDAVANSNLYPNVHFITLRLPLGPNLTNPYYIFGKATSVDAVTEEVMTIEEMFERIFHVENSSVMNDSVQTDSVTVD